MGFEPQSAAVRVYEADVPPSSCCFKLFSEALEPVINKLIMKQKILFFWRSFRFKDVQVVESCDIPLLLPTN